MNTIAPAFSPVRRDCNGMAALGRSPFDLRGIRFNGGEGGNAPGVQFTPPAGETPAPKPGEKPGEKPAEKVDPKPEDEQPAINPDTGKPYTAAESAAYASRIRAEAQGYRTERDSAIAERDAAQRDRAAVLAALGLDENGQAKPKTAEELLADVERHRSASEQTARENLVLRVSARAGINANADKLLDSRSFVSELSALDKADVASVEALVKATIQKDPSLVNTPPAASASGSVRHAGGGANNARPTKSEAINQRYNQK